MSPFYNFQSYTKIYGAKLQGTPLETTLVMPKNGLSSV